jgi:hypothetical protein
MHLTTCLKKHGITREQYSDLGDESTSDLSDNIEIPAEDSGITQKERIDNVFKGVPKQIDLARPFGEVIEEYGITEREFVALVNQWKGKGEIPPDLKIAQKENIGSDLAEKYKDQEKVNISNLNAAEVLVKKYGFECLAVKSATSTAPKTWVLQKKKVA